MGATITFLLIMAFLFAFSEIPKSWLCFVTVMGLLAQAGIELGMVGVMVAMVVFKVLKDIAKG